jgi:hypothetical protein
VQLADSLPSKTIPEWQKRPSAAKKSKSRPKKCARRLNNEEQDTAAGPSTAATSTASSLQATTSTSKTVKKGVSQLKLLNFYLKSYVSITDCPAQSDLSLL